MRYIEGADGKKRTSIITKSRFTKEEYKELNKMAKKIDYTDLREFLEGELSNAICRLYDRHEEHMQAERKIP